IASRQRGVTEVGGGTKTPSYDVSAFRFRGARREQKVPACFLDTEILKRIYTTLEDASQNSVDHQIQRIRAGIQSQERASVTRRDEESLNAEAERLRAIYTVGITMEGADGKRIIEYDKNALEPEQLPKPLLRLVFDIGVLASYVEPSRTLPIGATVVLDFSRPPAYDISNPSIAPTPNASSIVLYGTDETWVSGLATNLENVFSQNTTHRGWLHARQTYDLLLFVLGLPGALSFSGLLNLWVGQRIEQAAGQFIATSFVVIAFFFFLYVLRIGFGLMRWLYPYVEMSVEPKPLYARLRTLWSAMLLSVVSGVIVAGVIKLIGW
ncbi:MAG: hypothetical protein MN733_16330, partial [Nitrososphaera sp.]|nr:hypothetical protein [Nitrososphaera sp.]